MKEEKPQTIKSADNLIVKSEAEKLGRPIPEIKEEAKKGKIEKSASEEIALDSPVEIPVEGDKEPEIEPQPTEESSEFSEEEPSESPPENELDEYGTKVGKKKLYTEDEVQRMIRERLKRGQHAEQQDVAQAAKDFKADPESNESWEVQLEQFVDRTIEKREMKKRDMEWKEREEQTQAEFEVRFSQGMVKYKDFQEVVGNKPITNAMMLAARTMKDPAAFLYAACKQQAKEIERIAHITDPVMQATEIGRLEERMKKSRNLPSSPKPATKISGDTSFEMPQLDINQRIAEHAKTKIMRR